MGVLSQLIAKAIRPALTLFIPQVQPVAGSTGWFVVNTNSKAAEADPDDPVEFALGAQSKVLVIDTTGKSFLDLAHMYVGTNPAAAVSVGAFGFWVYGEGVTTADSNSIQPYGVSSSYPALGADNVGGGFWGPLFAPIPDGEHIQDLGTTPHVVSDAAAPNYKLTGGVSYALNGCSRAVVLVTTAQTDPTVGMIIGRLGN